VEVEQSPTGGCRSIKTYLSPPFSGPRLQDLGPLRDEPSVVSHDEFLENVIRQTLTHGAADTTHLADDWRFREIARLASSFQGHAFSSPRLVTKQLFSAAVDLERALFVVHPQLPAEAVADFWRSLDVRGHMDGCCDSQGLHSGAATDAPVPRGPRQARTPSGCDSH
jgi:hypothetical protein